MKSLRYIFTAFLCMAVLSCFAQRHQREFRPFEPSAFNKAPQNTRGLDYQLNSFEASDGYEIQEFTYNADNQFTDLYWQRMGVDDCHEVMSYNADGQMVRIDGYQLMDTGWTHVYYIEYTYDMNGRLASRANYNAVSNWSQGGFYTYSYNADGQILLIELTMGGTLFQTVEYEYVDGRLDNEIWSYGYAIMEMSYKYEYHYTGDNMTSTYCYEYENGSWVYAGREEYQYDANGNCTLYQKLSRDGAVTEKSVYNFNDHLLANTVMPFTPETERPVVYNNKNVYFVEEYYTIDNDNQLQYVCDYEYLYGPCSIENHQMTPQWSAYPNPASQSVTLQNVCGEQVEIYNMQGVLQSSFKAQSDNETVSVSSLPVGMYIVKVGQTTRKVAIVR